MSQFNLYFFKEKSRFIEVERLIDYFDKTEGFNIKMDERSVRFEYMMPNLGYKALFEITPKSKVPNISRLSAKYLEVNFSLELPILSPLYVAKKVFTLVKDITKTFNLYVYNELFEDVLPFDFDTLAYAYSKVKDAYLNKYPHAFDGYLYMKESKISSLLRYLDDLLSLREYYTDLNTIVPNYTFIKDEEEKPYLAVEYKSDTLSVFPPNIDYILYNHKDQIKVIEYNEFYKRVDKLLNDVPGFLQGTKVVVKKNASKLNKILKKHKFIPVEKRFTKYDLHQLMD